METLKTPSMHPGLGSATLLQLAFPGEGNSNFLWEKSHWDNTVVKKKAIIDIVRSLWFVLVAVSYYIIRDEIVRFERGSSFPVIRLAL